MLLSCGDALIDFLPVTSVDGRDAIVPAVGGSCLNVAVGMARLGAPAGFVGGISTDLFGRMIADHATASQVDLRYATRSEHQTTLAFVRTVAGSAYGSIGEAMTSMSAIGCLSEPTAPAMADFHRTKRRVHGLMRKLDRESRDAMLAIGRIAVPETKN